MSDDSEIFVSLKTRLISKTCLANKLLCGVNLNPATFGVPYAACRLLNTGCQGQHSGIELLQPAFGMLSDGCWPEQTLKRHLQIGVLSGDDPGHDSNLSCVEQLFSFASSPIKPVQYTDCM